MNKKVLIPLLAILPLVASCRGTPIQYERAKEIKESIKANINNAEFVPEVNLFTKKYYSVDGITEVTRQEIYHREKMFHSKYEIVGLAGKSVNETFYFRQDDPEKGIYLISAQRINGEWDNSKIVKTHYNTEEDVRNAWEKYHKESVLTQIISESKICLSKMEDIFEYADGDEIAVNVTCMSENSNSLSLEARYNEDSMVSTQTVINRHEYRLYLKDNIIASDERHIDSSHNSSLGYNYSKAIVNIPKLPS